MAPSVQPAARLSERPLFTVVGEAVQAAAGTGVRCESGRRRTPAGSASPEMRAMRLLLRHRHREVATRRRASFPRRLHVAPSSGVEPAGGLQFPARVSVGESSESSPARCRVPAFGWAWTSDQARRPAELKHINKRRKSN